MTHHAGKGGVYPVGTEWMGRYRPLVAALVKHTNVVQRAAGRTVARITGDMHLDGELPSTGDQTAAGISTAHHTHQGDSGGTTGEPQ